MCYCEHLVSTVSTRSSTYRTREYYLPPLLLGAVGLADRRGEPQLAELQNRHWDSCGDSGTVTGRGDTDTGQDFAEISHGDQADYWQRWPARGTHGYSRVGAEGFPRDFAVMGVHAALLAESSSG